MKTGKLLSSLLFLLTTVLLSSQSSLAQQKKGDFEITAFSSGFNFGFGGDFKSTSSDGRVTSTTTEKVQSFNLGGQAGYFLTRRHEVGGGLNLSVSRFEICNKFSGDETGEFCNSDTNVGLGLSAFYRYNIAKAEAKGFPFVGVTFSVASVTDNFTGNFRLRPHAGYKYFVKRNVALDFSVGYSFDVNKVDDSSVFIVERRKSVDGQLGLSFVF